MTSSVDPRRVPRDQLDKVVIALYADADAIGWENLSLSRRTAQYDRWVTAPAVGSVLATFMTTENARSWIKDGPMKEYSRARRGAGRYARFGQKSGSSVEQIIDRVLGDGYRLRPGSVGIKPFHCEVVRDGGIAFLIWGDARNLRHLIWAGLNYLIENPGTRVIIVVVEPHTRPTPKTEADKQDKIAGRCGLEIYRMREASNAQARNEIMGMS